MFIVLKKIVAKPLPSSSSPSSRFRSRFRFRFRFRSRFRFRLYCSNKSKITANQMCHFLIDGAKLYPF